MGGVYIAKSPETPLGVFAHHVYAVHSRPPRPYCSFMFSRNIVHHAVGIEKIDRAQAVHKDKNNFFIII